MAGFAAGVLPQEPSEHQVPRLVGAQPGGGMLGSLGPRRICQEEKENVFTAIVGGGRALVFHRVQKSLSGHSSPPWLAMMQATWRAFFKDLQGFCLCLSACSLSSLDVLLILWHQHPIFRQYLLSRCLMRKSWPRFPCLRAP